MKYDIKIEKVDKLTIKCTYLYENGAVFSRKISSQFDPKEQFVYNYDYFKKVMTSSMKTSTKLIAMFLPTIRFGNSPICSVPAYSIAHMLHLSYNTVRSGMKDLKNYGIVEEGKYIYNGNVINQYKINSYDKWRIPLGYEDYAVYDDDEDAGQTNVEPEEVYCDEIGCGYDDSYVSERELLV